MLWSGRRRYIITRQQRHCQQDPTKRTRQFELNAHFVRDAVAFRTVDLKYVTTKCQYADALTKAADAAMIAGLRGLMASMLPMPASFKLYGKIGKV